MFDYEKYEHEVEKRFKSEKRKPKKMKKLEEDRYEGRKLNHRTKKNKAKEI